MGKNTLLKAMPVVKKARTMSKLMSLLTEKQRQDLLEVRERYQQGLLRDKDGIFEIFREETAWHVPRASFRVWLDMTD